MIHSSNFPERCVIMRYDRSQVERIKTFGSQTECDVYTSSFDMSGLGLPSTYIQPHGLLYSIGDSIAQTLVADTIINIDPNNGYTYDLNDNKNSIYEIKPSTILSRDSLNFAEILYKGAPIERNTRSKPVLVIDTPDKLRLFYRFYRKSNWKQKLCGNKGEEYHPSRNNKHYEIHENLTWEGPSSLVESIKLDKQRIWGLMYNRNPIDIYHYLSLKKGRNLSLKSFLTKIPAVSNVDINPHYFYVDNNGRPMTFEYDGRSGIPLLPRSDHTGYIWLDSNGYIDKSEPPVISASDYNTTVASITGNIKINLNSNGNDLDILDMDYMFRNVRTSLAFKDDEIYEYNKAVEQFISSLTKEEIDEAIQELKNNLNLTNYRSVATHENIDPIYWNEVSRDWGGIEVPLTSKQIRSKSQGGDLDWINSVGPRFGLMWHIDSLEYSRHMTIDELKSTRRYNNFEFQNSDMDFKLMLPIYTGQFETMSKTSRSIRDKLLSEERNRYINNISELLGETGNSVKQATFGVLGTLASVPIGAAKFAGNVVGATAGGIALGFAGAAIYGYNKITGNNIQEDLSTFAETTTNKLLYRSGVDRERAAELFNIAGDVVGLKGREGTNIESFDDGSIRTIGNKLIIPVDFEVERRELGIKIIKVDGVHRLVFDASFIKAVNSYYRLAQTKESTDALVDSLSNALDSNNLGFLRKVLTKTFLKYVFNIFNAIATIAFANDTLITTLNFIKKKTKLFIDWSSLEADISYNFIDEAIMSVKKRVRSVVRFDTSPVGSNVLR